MSFFVGIAFDDATRAEVKRAVDLARPRAPDLKWEREEKAHLTLLFLAETQPDQAVVTAIAQKHAPFSLSMKGVGTFNERVLWVGLGGQVDVLKALQRELQDALGTHDEHGDYSPHVTLARARRGQRLPSSALRDYESQPFRVERLTFFESNAGEYRQLWHAALAAPPR